MVIFFVDVNNFIIIIFDFRLYINIHGLSISSNPIIKLFFFLFHTFKKE